MLLEKEQIDPWNRTESPEIATRYNQKNFDKGKKAFQWRKHSLFN